jgi:hypothetical protein
MLQMFGCSVAQAIKLPVRLHCVREATIFGCKAMRMLVWICADALFIILLMTFTAQLSQRTVAVLSCVTFLLCSPSWY